MTFNQHSRDPSSFALPTTTSRVLTKHERKRGVVYTPTSLSTYLADQVVRLCSDSIFPPLASGESPSLRFLDPACGDGELLVATWQAIAVEAKRRGIADRLPSARASLCGIDIDELAVVRAQERLTQVDSTGEYYHDFQLLRTNALCPERRSTWDGWRLLLKLFDAPLGFDLIVANPPWGADVSEYRTILDPRDFFLFQGQFDTSDLFLELSLTLLRPNGVLAIILPDSLFASERQLLRSLLLRNSQLRLVARLGERLFPRINRGTAVLICQRSAAPNLHSNVECMRLTPTARKRVLAGTCQLSDEAPALTHLVPQGRFHQSPKFDFDIEIRSSDGGLMSRLHAAPKVFGDYLFSGRGVELSKKGFVLQCRNCTKWMPMPATERRTCAHCGETLTITRQSTRRIVFEDPAPGLRPLLVGECVRRYSLRQPLWIDTSVDGVNFKSDHLYAGPKLLVRKTGVGISATIDYSNALTNQVVYVFKPLAETQFPLEIFLALLNSRVLYYFTAKKHGEVEWRSHPYVTQGQILDLPAPDFALISPTISSEINEIAAELRKLLAINNSVPRELDIRIELLCARLFGLSEHHYRQIFDVLESVESLLPVQNLKRISINDMFSC